jgi:hypothetical protein
MTTRNRPYFLHQLCYVELTVVIRFIRSFVAIDSFAEDPCESIMSRITVYQNT